MSSVFVCVDSITGEVLCVVSEDPGVLAGSDVYEEAYTGPITWETNNKVYRHAAGDYQLTPIV